MNEYLREIGAAIIAVGGAAAILASRLKSENIKDLKERVEILEKEREEGRQQHLENQKAIANLEGQLSTYKEIPLRQIAASLNELSVGNRQILSTLEHSAVISQQAQDDGGLLVKTKKSNPLAVEVKE